MTDVQELAFDSLDATLRRQENLLATIERATARISSDVSQLKNSGVGSGNRSQIELRELTNRQNKLPRDVMAVLEGAPAASRGGDRGPTGSERFLGGATGLSGAASVATLLAMAGVTLTGPVVLVLGAAGLAAGVFAPELFDDLPDDAEALNKEIAAFQARIAEIKSKIEELQQSANLATAAKSSVQQPEGTPDFLRISDPTADHIAGQVGTLKNRQRLFENELARLVQRRDELATQSTLSIDPSVLEAIARASEDWAAAQERIAAALVNSSADLQAVQTAVASLIQSIRQDLDLALDDSRAVWELYRDTAVAELCAIEDKADTVGEKLRGILGDAPIPGLPDGDENVIDRPSGSGTRRGGGTGRQITSGGGGVAPPRQLGGPVGAGLSFLVGEQGPEIFVPGRAGSILPNVGGRGFGPSSGGGLDSQIAALVAALDALRTALEAVTGAQGDFSDRLIEGQGAAQDFEMRLLSMDAAVQERLSPVLDVINTALPAAQAAVRALEDTTVESVAGAVDALLELTGADEGLRNLVGVIGTELTTALSGNLKTWEDWARFAISAIDNILGAVQQLRRVADGQLQRAFHVVQIAQVTTPKGRAAPCAA